MRAKLRKLLSFSKFPASFLNWIKTEKVRRSVLILSKKWRTVNTRIKWKKNYLTGKAQNSREKP